VADGDEGKQENNQLCQTSLTSGQFTHQYQKAAYDLHEHVEYSFVLVSSFIYFLSLLTCARLSWPHHTQLFSPR